MIPLRIENATRILGKSQGYLGLPILDHEGIMYSSWEPTPDELDKLNKGGKITLAVQGIAHPPVMLTVSDPT